MLCFLMTLLLLAGSATAVHAEEHKGDDGWSVEFTGKEMVSNFSTGSLADVILAMQPGDTASITLELKNDADIATDWYMTNEVLSSLEDSQEVAGGGAYTYILDYTDKDGAVTTLYSSESVGGEKAYYGREGLHEVSDSLEEYLYLDRLMAGEQGQINLMVALDGETQGNAYQNTLADLQMNFAVEKATAPEIPETPGKPRTPEASGRLVRTGDNNSIGLWSAIALVSGLLLLAVALVRRKKEKKRPGEEEAS